ncbi:hypothetical protein GQ44DRAFT_625341 [Phaeosphaeriaceae sp. PMI808]|nr:hypothetical protein GQ44DRAFT_625341 [Phaeosphaeriaceae sp. PMI808]
MTRVLVTGADGLAGSHILTQLLSYDGVSIRAVVNSQEAAHTLHHQYRRVPSSSLDVVTTSGRYFTAGSILYDTYGSFSAPFDAVVHTSSADASDEADCLARFIKIETEAVITFLKSIQETSKTVRRVVIVTSLTPFARWLVVPQVDRGPGRSFGGHSRPQEADADSILATCQASNSIVYEDVMKWVKTSGALFDVTYITAPSVYGPTVYPLETSSDLSETSRRIWNICSGEPRERTELPPYGMSHFTDVRDLATASIRALFIPEASNRRFVISAGIMPSGSHIAEELIAQFPELQGRIRMDVSPPRQRQVDSSSPDYLDSFLMTTVLGIPQLHSAEVTLVDTTRQILDLQQRKAWKRITQS